MNTDLPIVLVDMNVILDLVLVRVPWVDESGALMSALQRGVARGVIASHSVTTIYYLVSRMSGPVRARQVVHDLLETLEVIPVSANELRRAMSRTMHDFEDAVQAEAAVACGARWIATRNIKDFASSDVPARSPGQLLGVLTLN
jgi:predicted nucleic acid-binding protein